VVLEQEIFSLLIMIGRHKFPLLPGYKMDEAMEKVKNREEISFGKSKIKCKI
jgi:hypothetical protein